MRRRQQRLAAARARPEFVHVVRFDFKADMYAALFVLFL